MPDEVLALFPSLRNLPAFENLTDAEILRIIEPSQLVTLGREESLSLPVDLQAPFYMVISGKATHQILQSGGETRERLLKAGSFVGADYVLYGLVFPQSIVARTPVKLLYLDSANLAQLLTELPDFKEGLRKVDYASRQTQDKHFQWIGEDEIVHLITRKHPANLLVALAIPALVTLVAGLFFLGTAIANVASVRYALEWVGFIILFLAILFAAWQIIDWGNDYYVITDQRVVWLEKVIGLYDSRQEVPLVMVQSSQINSTFLGRMLGYGDVTAQAFLGRVVFRKVGDPEKVKAVLDKWQRLVSMRVQKSDTDAMEKVIRRKIDPPPEPPIQVQARSQPAETLAPPLQKQRRRFSEFFRERMEDGDVVTYRKHIYVLITKVWIQSLLGIVLFFLGYAVIRFRAAGSISFGLEIAFLIALVLAGIAVFLSWLYFYIDWRNDIYRITSDKLIDSMKKPLGDEVTKSAPLANIQSLDYERKGIIGVLLNYGNVMVNVGTDKLIFVGVHDPARVQADIFSHMYTSQRRKQLSEAAKQWDQVSDWLAAYHRQAEDLRKTQEQSKNE